MSSAMGGVRLLSRHLRSGSGPSILVAAIVLVCSFFALSAPLALGRLADAEVRSRLAEIPDVRRAVTGYAQSFPYPQMSPDTAEQAWRPITDTVQQQRDALPRPLRDGVGQPLFELRTAPTPVSREDPSAPLTELGLSADPAFDGRVRWVRGQEPALWRGTTEFYRSSIGPALASGPPIPIGLSAPAARSMRIEVGEVLGRGNDLPLVVAGIYEVRDRGAEVWRFRTGLDRAVNNPTPDGNTRYTAAAVVSPRTPGIPGPLDSGSVSLILPVRTDAWDADDARRVSPQLRAATVRGLELPDSTGTPLTRLTTDTTDALDEANGRNDATSTVVALVSAGAVAVALLVLALGIGAVLDRRRPAIDLVAARGASAVRVRAAAALEGAALGIPAAVAGALLGALPLPPAVPLGHLPLGPVALCALFGLAPAVVGFALSRPGPTRFVRADLGGRRWRRWRWVAEAALVLLAGAVTTTLVLRGRAQDASTLDPLLVLTPVLLAVAFGLLTLRAYPLPLRLAQAALHRRRRAAGFLGVARGVREPTLGLASALAILTGVSVGVLSAVLVGTVDSGTRQAARAAVGGDIRAELAASDPSARLPAIAGLRDVAPIAPQRSVSFRAASVDLVSAPLDAPHRIRADVPAGLTRPSDGAIPILVSSDLDVAVGARVRLARRPAVVVGRLPADAGLGVTRQWVLVDHRFAAELVRNPTPALLVLADVAPGASARAVAARLRAAVPRGTVVTDAETTYAELRATPSVGGLGTALGAAAAVAALLALLGAVLAVVAATRRRDRTVALLRVLGLSRGQARSMAAVELAPVAVALVAGGALLGVGLAAFTTEVIDLRPFTGAEAAVPVVVAPAPVAAVAGGFLLLAAIVTAVAARLSSRVTPADVLRKGG